MNRRDFAKRALGVGAATVALPATAIAGVFSRKAVSKRPVVEIPHDSYWEAEIFLCDDARGDCGFLPLRYDTVARIRRGDVRGIEFHLQGSVQWAGAPSPAICEIVTRAHDTKQPVDIVLKGCDSREDLLIRNAIVTHWSIHWREVEPVVFHNQFSYTTDPCGLISIHWREVEPVVFHNQGGEG